MSLNNSDDDLTTDAIPSPPRDKDTHNNQNENVENNNTTRPNVTSHKIPKSKRSTKTKKNTPTAFASVINISNANGIQIGSNYNIYVNKSENKQRNEYVITEAVKCLFNSAIPVERKHLIFLAPHLNEEWRLTARMLNYSDGQISQFYEDYSRSGIKEVIYQLLLDWTQNEATSATVGKLSNALWHTSQQDAVLRWADNFSS